MNTFKINHVILSGGVGSRLWPLSRKSCPKQYLEIFSGQSLFELCVERNSFLKAQRIVVGNRDNFQLSRNILSKIGVKNYKEIIEAVPKNTAPAIAFAACISDPEDILLVTPSDHLIGNKQRYQKAVLEAVNLAQEGKLVTFGITPNAPETGYGYIQAEGQRVIKFKEKPSIDFARLFIEAGNHFWNSGMFCFKAKTFLEELAKFQPEVLEKTREALAGSNDGFIDEVLNAQIPSISIDYALMEKSDMIAMVEGSFDWSDLGSFDSLSEQLSASESIQKDEGGNLSIGSSRHVSFVGVSNTIFVETADAFLILDKSSSQDVKQVFERLEKEQPNLIS